MANELKRVFGPETEEEHKAKRHKQNVADAKHMLDFYKDIVVSLVELGTVVATDDPKELEACLEVVRDRESSMMDCFRDDLRDEFGGEIEQELLDKGWCANDGNCVCDRDSDSDSD